MVEFPIEKIYAAIIIWIGLIISAVLIAWIQFYKRSFLDDIFYRKHCLFWIYLATSWYFIGSVYLGAISFDLYGGVSNPIDVIFYVPNFLFGFSIPFLVLLAVSLGPAKWQNKFGKSS